jgi:hypothetical protein
LSFGPAGGHWEISGPESSEEAAPDVTRKYSSRGWPVSLAGFYAINSAADLRAYAEFQSYDSSGSSTELTGIGLGSKFRVATGTDWEPNAALLVLYYPSIDAGESGHDRRPLDSVETGFGLRMEAGVSYLMTDSFSLNIGVGYERALSNLGVDVYGKSGRYRFSSLGVCLGMAFYM